MATAPGRNDPCPCGSDKKWKKCCALLPKPPSLVKLATAWAQTTEGDSPAWQRIALDPASPHFGQAIGLIVEDEDEGQVRYHWEATIADDLSTSDDEPSLAAAKAECDHELTKWNWTLR